MKTLTTALERLYLGFIVIAGVLMVLSIPQYFGISIIDAEFVGVYLAVGIAAGFLRFPYGARAGVLEILLGIAAIASWAWMSAHYDFWIIDIEGVTPAKYVPGIIAIVLMMEAMRKSAGLPITILVWVLVGYGLVGYLLPPPFQSEELSAPRLAFYLYADTNGIPGLVLNIISSLVLAFILLGKLMEVSGATRFFTDMALAGMGHRRGGPAKVAVVASSVFGTISGSTVGNIMSTGIVTIPLMKRSGFRAQHAAAIEAVASNGGQFAPPVMGATAFLIAEFLQISYTDVVIAAAVPAILYYVCLFMQVDAIAARHGLHGLPREELPDPWAVAKEGWVFVVPLAVLIYLLFWRALDPALSAMAAVIALYFLTAIRRRSLMSRSEWADFIFGGGENMLPLILIGGAAGAVIGVMNITGLGFSLSLVLTHVGENGGLLAMLLLTAAIAIVLGMGMPTAAVYVVLSVILAPALTKMGVIPLGAHLFIFYFGLLSFLTPPVAVASYVAAGLAGADMWRTGWVGMQLATVAYLLPFLWCYNGALIFEGSTLAVVLAVLSALSAAMVIARGMQAFGLGSAGEMALAAVLVLVAVGIGGSTVWFGPESPLTFATAAAGFVLYGVLRKFRIAVAEVRPAE